MHSGKSLAEREFFKENVWLLDGSPGPSPGATEVPQSLVCSVGPALITLSRRLLRLICLQHIYFTLIFSEISTKINACRSTTDLFLAWPPTPKCLRKWIPFVNCFCLETKRQAPAGRGGCVIGLRHVSYLILALQTDSVCGSSRALGLLRPPLTAHVLENGPF